MGANCSSPTRRKEKVAVAFSAAIPVLIGREGGVEVKSSSFNTVPSLAISAIQEPPSVVESSFHPVPSLAVSAIQEPPSVMGSSFHPVPSMPSEEPPTLSDGKPVNSS